MPEVSFLLELAALSFASGTSNSLCFLWPEDARHPHNLPPDRQSSEAIQLLCASVHKRTIEQHAPQAWLPQLQSDISQRAGTASKTALGLLGWWHGRVVTSSAGPFPGSPLWASTSSC